MRDPSFSTAVSGLRQGKACQGIMFRLLQGNASLQLAKSAGFDFVIFDLEHGSFSIAALADLMLFARSVNLGALVRVPHISRGNVSRILDCGADGVMVPMLESADQARELVELAKYPPLGRRGFSSIGGHSDYRKIADCRSFLRHANESTLAIAQIETAAGVRNIESIARIPGLDAVLVGPNDLALSLGCPGDFSDPRMTEAMERVSACAASAGLIFGLHAPPPLLAEWIPGRLSLVVNGLDIDVIARAFAEVSDASRTLIGRAGPATAASAAVV